MAGFEPTAPRSQSGCATKLRHTPWRTESRWVPIGPAPAVLIARNDAAIPGRDEHGRRTYGRRMARPCGDDPVLVQARELFDEFQWRSCADRLTSAGAQQPLDGDALLLLGDAAFLIGDDERAVTAFGQAYQGFLEAGNVRAAARSAVSCGFILDNAGEAVRARAWAARAQHLVDQHDPDGAAAGWLLAYRAKELVMEQRLAEALAIGREGERVGWPPVMPTPSCCRSCRSDSRSSWPGSASEAVRTYDELMLAVSSNETSPPSSASATARRSRPACSFGTSSGRGRGRRRWTAGAPRGPTSAPTAERAWSTGRRCPRSVGDWAAALGEAATAQRLLRGPAAGEAAYQLGELHRLMGHTAEAEDAYRRANALGVQPEPGLSRLRTAQGRPEVAARTLRRLCGEPRPPEDLAELLAAQVEAEVLLGNVEAARAAAEELRAITDGSGAPLLRGLADQSDGAVLLAAGRPDAALDALRRAQRCWAELDLPHSCAQARLLAGRCLRELEDQEAADREFEAARECFERLGADPDLARLDALASVPRPDPARPGGLTERELEVVRLVAAGHTNRVIAARLSLSEKTVARHLANIYAKLDIPSRAAATAYAYDHGLV